MKNKVKMAITITAAGVLAVMELLECWNWMRYYYSLFYGDGK